MVTVQNVEIIHDKCNVLGICTSQNNAHKCITILYWYYWQ